jgi:RHS repeat-associated protein
MFRSQTPLKYQGLVCLPIVLIAALFSIALLSPFSHAKLIATVPNVLLLSCSNPGTSTDRPNNHFPLHPNGSLVKVNGIQTVYLIDGGRKRAISSPSVLANLYPNGGFGNNDVITIGTDELGFYTPGADVTSQQPGNGRNQPDGRLIQNPAGEVSIISNVGGRRAFATPTRFLDLGYQFCNVVSLTSQDYNAYPVGMVVGEFPVPSAPADGSTGQSVTPTFNWSSVAQASSYRIAVATSSSALPIDPGSNICPSCVIFASAPSNSFTPSPGVLSAGTTYFWNVEAINVPDTTVWSATRSFTTAAPADGMTLISQDPPDDFQVGSNQLFNATWRLSNTGATTWNSNFSAVWIQTAVNGNPSTNLTSPIQVGALLSTTAPGLFFDLNISMIGPSTPGTYYMYWQLQNPAGVSFGTPFRVKIVVVQAGDESYGNDKEGFGSGDSPGSNAGINDDSLNTSTGNFNYQTTDLVVPGRGLDFVFSRSYNAKDNTASTLSPGWSHSFNIYVTSQNSSVATLHYGDGKVLAFGNTGANLYKALSKGYYDTLTRNGDNTWTLLKPDQKEYHFDINGRLVFIQDRNSNRITLNYNANNLLSSVVDTVGRQFTFSYSSGVLTDITDPIGRHLQFQYTSSRLTQFRDAKNQADNYSYDGNGRIFEVFDARGIRKFSNSYDSQGRLIAQTNSRGFQWSFSYDDVNHVTRVTDPNQKQIIYNHGSGNNLLSFTNRTNAQTTITYDANNNRQSVTDLNGAQFAYSYDSSGNTKTSTDPAQKTRQFSYDAKNNPIQATDELSHSTSMGYDARGNLISLTDALSKASSIAYNSFGQPTAITDPNQHTANLTYDSQGNLRTVQDALGLTTTFDYDGVGRRTRVTNARGKITFYSYDNNDNLTSVQRPIGTTSYGYDFVDNLVSVSDPNQNTTQFEYDGNNNRTKETDALGNFIRHTYDSLDRLVSTRDKRGNTTSFTYDNEGRLLSVTDALTNTTSFTYDGNGNKLTSKDANNQTTKYTYDSLNRLTGVEDPLHNIDSRDYDAAGRVTRDTDARGNATRFTYDEVNNLTRVVDAENGTTEYTYDNNHNLKTEKDANLHLSNLTYDNDDRLVSSSDPLGNSYSYAYDAVGNRIAQSDAKHQIIQFTYDDNDRLTRISYPDSSSVQMTYDANGNLTQVFDVIGTTTYSYDQLNRIRTYTDAYGKTISYQYDQNDNTATLTYPDGKQVNYSYDANDRMTSLTDWSGRTVSYQYNSIGLLTRITPPTSSDNGPTTYTYDLAGRLTGMTNFHSRGTNNSYAFTLDQNGNRVTASVQESLNNRVAVSTQSYSYDNANRIQTAGPGSFLFDANGNMTSKTENGVTTNYSYDFNDRLLNDQANTYIYNGQGTRVAEIRAGVLTRYVVDVNRELSQVLCETDGAGNITSYYVYGEGLVYKVLLDGAHYYYQFDPNGSTVSMTTDFDFYVNRYSYDPYGKVTNSSEVFPNTNSTVANPFKFGGRFGLMDEGNGLVYVRARYYVPELGRFLTKDPLTGDLKDGQTLNRYIYAVDNPVKFVDADGRFAFEALRHFAGDVPLERVKGAAIKAVVKLGLSATRNQLTKYINTNGFSSGGEAAFSTYTGLGTDLARGVAENSLSAVINVGQRVAADWKNPNMSRLEKAARVSLTISDTALTGIASEGGPWLGAFGGAGANASFEVRYGFIKKNIADPIGGAAYNVYTGLVGKTPESTEEYGREQDRQMRIRQQQRQRAAIQAKTSGPVVKVMPRGPAATPIMPRGPKPAPISPRGTR